MENSTSLKENLDTLFVNLERFLKTETVVGEPIVIGDTTIVPIVSVSFGCGTSGGTGNDKSGKGVSGAGIGAGAKITPDAVLVIKNNEVTMLPIKEGSSMDRLMAMVPGILRKIKHKKDDSNKSEDKAENTK